MDRIPGAEFRGRVIAGLIGLVVGAARVCAGR